MKIDLHTFLTTLAVCRSLPDTAANKAVNAMNDAKAAQEAAEAAAQSAEEHVYEIAVDGTVLKFTAPTA